MKKKILIFLFVLICVQAQSIETKIIHNIQNEIITNIDIKNEFKYLLALNNSLKELDEEKVLNISNESVIREKIKKIEISKNFKDVNSISFKTRRNRKLDLTEYYNLVYEYKNDCLIAGIKYNKTYYKDGDIVPVEELFFSITIVPLGTFSPSKMALK